MYSITVQKHFDSAHYLRGYPGKCSQVHGHRWFVQVSLERDRLDNLGVLFDFAEIKAILDSIIEEQFDHHTINIFPPFTECNPTAENIAKFFYDMLKTTLPVHINLMKVRIYESPDCYAEYWE